VAVVVAQVLLGLISADSSNPGSSKASPRVVTGVLAMVAKVLLSLVGSNASGAHASSVLPQVVAGVLAVLAQVLLGLVAGKASGAYTSSVLPHVMTGVLAVLAQMLLSFIAGKTSGASASNSSASVVTMVTNAVAKFIPGLREHGAGSRAGSGPNSGGTSQLVVQLLLIPHCGRSGVSHAGHGLLIAGYHSGLVLCGGCLGVPSVGGVGCVGSSVAVPLAHHLLDGSHGVQQLLLGGHVGRHCFLLSKLAVLRKRLWRNFYNVPLVEKTLLERRWK
jgi:hypothetical protein